MKYFLHDSNAFNDEKITQLFIKFGYEGIGLFFTILEKLAGQEKPVNTLVLKHQLKVGKKLEKCWSFLEEIELISSNNGETFNKQLLNFSEKYKIKSEKNAKRISEWRKNQSDTENVTRYEHVCNTPKVNISKVKESKDISIESRQKLIDDILLFFGFKPGEPKSIPHQREINRFLTEIIKEGLFEVFTDQYQNFKKVKAENPKFNYSLKNFLFSDIGDASGGQWNAFDWGLKIKELKTSDLVPEGAKSRIEEIKQMIKRNETKL